MGRGRNNDRTSSRMKLGLRAACGEKGNREFRRLIRSSAAEVRLVLQKPARPARRLIDPKSEQAQVR